MSIVIFVHGNNAAILGQTNPIKWRIQDFPEGAPTPEVVALTYYFAKFCQKVRESENIGLRGFAFISAPSLDPPMQLGIFNSTFVCTSIEYGTWSNLEDLKSK